ncbi:MAG: hypothetical protein ACOX2M_07835 [Fastidiosipilaceae bacterium]
MNWNEEALKFKPVTERDVVNFASPREKAEAVDRYNRAVKQIQKGNVDMAAIALKSLSARYPMFVQAVQLNACCQMVWRDTKTAGNALRKLLKSSMLTAAERERTENYLRLLTKDSDPRGRRGKASDEFPHFDIENLSHSMLEIPGVDVPVEMAGKDEIEAIKSGKPFGDPGFANDRRIVTYGSRMRQSERAYSYTRKGEVRRQRIERKRRAQAPSDRREETLEPKRSVESDRPRAKSIEKQEKNGAEVFERTKTVRPKAAKLEIAKKGSKQAERKVTEVKRHGRSEVLSTADRDHGIRAPKLPAKTMDADLSAPPDDPRASHPGPKDTSLPERRKTSVDRSGAKDEAGQSREASRTEAAAVQAKQRPKAHSTPESGGQAIRPKSEPDGRPARPKRGSDRQDARQLAELKRPPSKRGRGATPNNRPKKRKGGKRKGDVSLALAVAVVVVLILIFVLLLIVREKRNQTELPTETFVTSTESSLTAERGESTYVSFTVPTDPEEPSDMEEIESDETD